MLKPTNKTTTSCRSIMFFLHTPDLELVRVSRFEHSVLAVSDHDGADAAATAVGVHDDGVHAAHARRPPGAQQQAPTARWTQGHGYAQCLLSKILTIDWGLKY